MKTIRHNNQEYPLVRLMEDPGPYQLYECRLPNGKTGILKIAGDPSENVPLDREAFALRELRTRAMALDDAEPNKQKKPNLRTCFPDLVDSFISVEHEGCRVNVLDLSHSAAEDLGELVPIGRLAAEERVRVDPKTSVWMMGKMLKFLTFVHECGFIAGPAINGESFLIHRDWHLVLLFNWGEVEIAAGDVVHDVVAAIDIAAAAREVILALGGDPDKGTIPDDPQLTDDSYADILRRFVREETSGARKAREDFYGVVEVLWGIKYHAYADYPI